jgi:MFS family permease
VYVSGFWLLLLNIGVKKNIYIKLTWWVDLVEVELILFSINITQNMSSENEYQIILAGTSIITALLVRAAQKENAARTALAAPPPSSSSTSPDSENKSTSPNQDEIQTNFTRFKLSYLIVYFLMVAGDWLQGPFVYSLYSTYGFSKQQIGQLFVVGFGASMIVGTFVGSLADSMGRKKFCLLYCALYIASCATKHFNDFNVLLLGRLLGGTATSLLFSVFESWLVCAHNTRGFGEERLGVIFSQAIFGNSIVAILSGVVAQAVADALPMSQGPFFFWGGYTSPFDLASIVLVIGAVYMSSTWEENHGERQASNFSLQALTSAMSMLRQNHAAFLAGLVQSLFEGAMYSFVFEWTPALTPEKGPVPPYGLIFATFMVCCMAGSQLFSKVLSMTSPQGALPWVFAVSAVSLGAVPMDDMFGTRLSYYGMLIFEVCVGLYFPLMSTLKSNVVPEQHRSTVYNIFRIPLNAIVLFVLLNNFSVRTTFTWCVILLLTAMVLQLLLIKQMGSKGTV